MHQRFVTLLGKSVRQLALLRGGGSALPGLFVETIDPGFIARTLTSLTEGIILVSGTNGKTTTTKMVVELLESQGKKVFTNRTGSNFTRGVAAALLGDVDANGNLDADIAVLELDEAHAVHFVKAIKPRYSLLLNVMRDQLDRFGEIDTTAALLHTIAENTTDSVVLNRDDPRLGSPVFRKGITAAIRTYGVSTSLLSQFPSDDHMREIDVPISKHFSLPSDDDTSLEHLDGQTARIRYNNTLHDVSLQLKGIYNVQNAVGAIAMIRAICGESMHEDAMLASLAKVQPAFGRGETLTIDGKPCEIVLVKNPSGFRLSLSSFKPEGYATMIAINDDYADGRDMSWLWDVEFESLQPQGVQMVSGIRAYDMALRLQYDEIELSHVETKLSDALALFLSHNSDKPKRIYCTYTAMLALRRLLAKQTNVEVVR
jgi:UDP-N-acetylmuramyl tripeptide synthase